MALHKNLLDFAALQFSNSERTRIDDWLKANTPNFEAQNLGDGKCEMYLNGVIGDDFGGVTAARFEQQLKSLGDAKEILLHVNSPGGFIDDAMAMYNALVRHPAKIITNVTGQASSSASWVVQAGDVRQMGESTSMFLHRAMGLTMGNDIDHEKKAGYLKGMSEAIANVYANRSGRRPESFMKLMTDETQLSAKDALDHKLIDVIIPLKKARNEVERVANTPVLDSPVNARSIIDRKLRKMAMEAS